jgi:hypothetical protein
MATSHLSRSLIAAALLTLAGVQSALAHSVACDGHMVLPKPRLEGTCLVIRPQVYASPDGAIRATVLPSDVDLYATPDLESHVVFRTATGKLITSKDYSSPRGSNGYYVVNAAWSPDSQFFAFSLSSSGGHSPWSFPIWVFSSASGSIVSFSAMIDDKPTLSGSFKFTAPHTLTATTWMATGDIDHGVPVAVDVAEAIKKLPPSQD